MTPSLDYRLCRSDKECLLTRLALSCLVLTHVFALLVWNVPMVAAEPGPIVRAANMIRAHQAADGAIAQDALPAVATRIVPYFANFAALGLVAAFRKSGDWSPSNPIQ